MPVTASTPAAFTALPTLSTNTNNIQNQHFSVIHTYVNYSFRTLSILKKKDVLQQNNAFCQIKTPFIYRDVLLWCTQCFTVGCSFTSLFMHLFSCGCFLTWLTHSILT
jgi:hypothetical protein